MHRLGQTVVYFLIVLVVYNALLGLSRQLHAGLLEYLLEQVGHARGFTLAITAAGMTTGELGLVALITFGVFLATWPSDDPMATAAAIVAGGIVGALTRRFVLEHRDDRSSGQSLH